MLRINRYERRPGDPDPEPEQLRVGDHTDDGIFTILLADAVPGLQIIGPDGAWRDVTPRDGNVVVNLGDALAIWTNDRWRSTVHRAPPWEERVTSPPVSTSGVVGPPLRDAESGAGARRRRAHPAGHGQAGGARRW